MRRLLPLFLMSGFLSSCAHYRSSVGDYRGLGAYRRPSDYSAANAEPEWRVAPVAKNYRPRGLFQLQWPVSRVRLTQKFKRWPRHEGIDLGGYMGMPILAAHEGVVIYAGKAFQGYGKMVILEYDREWATLYSHMTEISVSEGMILNPGDPIGTMGRTGRATGVHLHFELIQNKQPIDPLPVIRRNSLLSPQRAL